MSMPAEWRRKDIRLLASWSLLPLHRQDGHILALCPSPISFGEHWSVFREVLGEPYRLIRTQDDPNCHDWLVAYMAKHWFETQSLQIEDAPTWKGTQLGLPQLPGNHEARKVASLTQLTRWALATLNDSRQGNGSHPIIKMAGLLVAQACELGMTGIRVAPDRYRGASIFLHQSQICGAGYFPSKLYGPLVLAIATAAGLSLEQVPPSDASFELERNRRSYRVSVRTYLEECGECIDLTWC
ncbi:MAG: hypothetical protein HS116_23910 [Planctomycetes bacterium]|nr:hypothetical protein [Planctomycetota bacterium]